MTQPGFSSGRALVALLGAFSVALMVFVGVILPAEYSIDPLGTGAYVGVLGLASEPADQFRAERCPHVTDKRVFQLAPYESVEYSYGMARSARLLFSWRSSGELHYNLHGTLALGASLGIDQRPEAHSASAGVARQQHGEYRAPFNGRHGWFWENRSSQTQTLELFVAGFARDAEQAADHSLARREVAPVLVGPPGCAPQV